MSKRTDKVCELINNLSDEEKQIVLDYLRRRLPRHALEEKFGTTAEAILTAIARSADLTLRGVRGILAEQAFEEYFIPKLKADGWNTITIQGNQTYDFVVEKSARRVTIQVKLQRSEKHIPLEYAPRSRKALKCPSGRIYVVEVQKTRGGKKNGEETRPYRFGDFDILAVNMQASSGVWQRFMFTPGSWLIPNKKGLEMIETLQPVSECADEYWTDDLQECIGWFSSGKQKRLYAIAE